jgi:hypothetical protein
MRDQSTAGRGPAELIFGERDGRLRVPVGGLPQGAMAVSVPVRRGGEAKVPRDRRRRLKIVDVDLISAGPTDPYGPSANLSARDLIFALGAGRRDWSTVENFFGPARAWDVALALVRCGGVVLRCGTDENLALTRPVSWRRSHAWTLQHADLLNDLRGRPDPDALRADLLDLMTPVDELRSERVHLGIFEPGSPLRVPPQSATGTNAWSVYENAIRAAALWWTHQKSNQQPLTAKGLASKAFLNSKGWTPERELAFSNLVGTSFDNAVSKADTAVRLRGPLVWRMGRVAADAGLAMPWISLPANGLHAAGIISCDAEGILLIENSDTFEEVCKVSGATDRWLCVWGEGYISDGVVALLASLSPRPVAAWCDLDADGIQIVSVLTQRLMRDIHPIGMDIELWRSTPHRRQKAAEVERDKKLATKMSTTGPESLRSLAREIAVHGGSCEQEGIQDLVLPRLAEVLAKVVGTEGSKHAERLGPG